MEHLPGAKPMFAPGTDKARDVVLTFARTMELDDTLEHSQNWLRHRAKGVREGCQIFRYDAELMIAEMNGCDAGLAEGLAILAARHEAKGTNP